MAVRFRDYKVPFKSEESIAKIALEWRRAAGSINSAYFNIVDFIETVLVKHLRRRDGLKIRFFEAGPEDDPAFVTYKSLTLHIDSELWKLAKLGEPGARYIVAHEIGHVILHDYHAKAFSTDASQNLKFVQNENSAEWQAHRFADHLLLPNELVKAFTEVTSMAQSCSVPQELASERFSKVHAVKRMLRGYSGEACPTCNNFTLFRVGLFQRCDTCKVIIDEFGNVLEEELFS
jgi:IrrE N-terminal-like domain